MSISHAATIVQQSTLPNLSINSIVHKEHIHVTTMMILPMHCVVNVHFQTVQEWDIIL